ncbi:MAG: hypothetical protein WD448_06445 [Woeseia sp.]
MEAEPSNQPDPNAIAVFGARKSLFGRVEKKIGYIPAEISSQIADAGLSGQAVLRPKSLYISDDGYVDLKFDLLGPKELYEQYSKV